ncbi:MAG: non-canonical purine NTP pyrophosphatase, partial [Ignavibacteria bacterium]|nr:non-canonical purine NTP pyrophosphatase [Ignavibacteria bacterium]
MKLVIASNNKHKVNEIKTILNSLRFEILSLEDLNLDIEVLEDQPTFEGNARKKASEVYSLIKLPTFADDSGLMVEKLNGEPGVFS